MEFDVRLGQGTDLNLEQHLKGWGRLSIGIPGWPFWKGRGSQAEAAELPPVLISAV